MRHLRARFLTRPTAHGAAPPDEACSFHGSRLRGETMRFVPKWRVFTWVIVIINVLFLVWIITGVNSASQNCNGLHGQNLSSCQAGTAIGGTLAVGVIVFFWVM